MFWQALFAVAVVVVLWWKFSSKRTIKVHGEVHPSFEKVREKFSAMVQQDNEGAALAVLHQGKVVVHLFGGYANREKNQSWTEDTMAIAYSTTKIWAALTSAVLAGRGLLHYDENATPHWTPGSHRGYHALTYGFLVDQIIKRLHPKGYDVPKIYKEEIWEEGRTLVCNLSKDSIPYNDSAVRKLPLTSCMGIGTALGFAQAIQQVFK
ncbi:beta-lactamase, partial [Teladorsagia circumcincta]